MTATRRVVLERTQRRVMNFEADVLASEILEVLNHIRSNTGEPWRIVSAEPPFPHPEEK